MDREKNHEGPIMTTVSIQCYGDLILETGKLGDAIWSKDKKYRYRLRRPLAGTGPVVAVCMQNPSKAGPDDNDPTVARVVGFANRLNASMAIVVNMGAGVATDPADFLKLEDPVGPRNLDLLRDSALGVDVYVAAWGALNPRLRRLFRLSLGVVKQFSGLKCWGKTKAGDPRHPLYLPGSAELIDFA